MERYVAFLLFLFEDEPYAIVLIIKPLESPPLVNPFLDHPYLFIAFIIPP